MSHNPDCIFCQIIAGTAPAHRVDEDDNFIVFMDLFPVEPGHTLIVPKPHWENLFETPATSLADLIVLSKSVAHAIQRALEPDGIGVYQLNGAAAGQTVFHYHMHLIPRMQGSSLRIHGRKRGDRAELERMAAKIKAQLQAIN